MTSSKKTHNQPKKTPLSKTDLSKKSAIDLYSKMYLIRKFEEKAALFYNMGKIHGFCHLYIGQEAVITGIKFNSTKKDSMITSYRDHAHALMSGFTPLQVMAELLGKKEGATGGKGGSMHFYSKENKFYGGHGIVGTPAPLGTGIAFSHKYKKDGGTCVSYFGDGAALQGQVAEAFNMASLWKLPVIYVIENNQYAMGTSIDRSHAVSDLSKLGTTYNIPALDVDGMDVIDVIEKSQKAFTHTRSGKGPMLLNIWTYRYRGHSMSDPGRYRDRSEVEKIRNERDPINSFKEYLQKLKILNISELQSIEKNIQKSMQELEVDVLKLNNPDPSELYNNILA